MLRIETEEAINVDHAYAIFSNLIEHQKTREILAKQGYFLKIYEFIMPYLEEVINDGEAEEGLVHSTESPEASPMPREDLLSPELEMSNLHFKELKSGESPSQENLVFT